MSDYILLEERTLLSQEVRQLKDEIKFLKAENLKLRETQKLGAAEMHGLHDAYLGKLKESTAFLEGLNRQLSRLGELATTVLKEGSMLDGQARTFTENYTLLEKQARQVEDSYKRHLQDLVSTASDLSKSFHETNQQTLNISQGQVDQIQITVLELFQRILEIIERPRANDALEREVLTKLNRKLE